MTVEATNPPHDPRFPIGPFKPPATMVAESRLSALATLAELPTRLRNATAGLDTAQLETAYRDGGWTLRQLVHHVADSHMMAFIRMRLALTADWPPVLAYDEAACARLRDAAAPIEWSLTLVESLHARWVMMLQSLTEEQWQSGYIHSVDGRVTIEQAALLYAWHSSHHVAHITRLRDRKRW